MKYHENDVNNENGEHQSTRNEPVPIYSSETCLTKVLGNFQLNFKRNKVKCHLTWSPYDAEQNL